MYYKIYQSQQMTNSQHRNIRKKKKENPQTVKRIKEGKTGSEGGRDHGGKERLWGSEGKTSWQSQQQSRSSIRKKKNHRA